MWQYGNKFWKLVDEDEFLEKEYAPQFTIEDLVNLGFAQIYLKLMIEIG